MKIIENTYFEKKYTTIVMNYEDRMEYIEWLKSLVNGHIAKMNNKFDTASSEKKMNMLHSKKFDDLWYCAEGKLAKRYEGEIYIVNYETTVSSSIHTFVEQCIASIVCDDFDDYMCTIYVKEDEEEVTDMYIPEYDEVVEELYVADKKDITYYIVPAISKKFKKYF